MIEFTDIQSGEVIMAVAETIDNHGSTEIAFHIQNDNLCALAILEVEEVEKLVNFLLAWVATR